MLSRLVPEFRGCPLGSKCIVSVGIPVGIYVTRKPGIVPNLGLSNSKPGILGLLWLKPAINTSPGTTTLQLYLILDLELDCYWLYHSNLKI